MVKRRRSQQRVPEVPQTPLSPADEQEVGRLEGLGRACLDNHQYAEAVEHFDRALALDPESAMSWGGKGMALLSLDCHEEGGECVLRAVELAPGDITGRLVLIHWLSEGGHPDLALEYLETLLEFVPENGLAWQLKAALLTRAKRREEALKAIDRSIELAPDQPGSWGMRSLILADLGRHEEALEACDRELQFDQGDAKFWAVRGTCLKALGRDLEALESLTKATTLDPTRAQAWLCKADLADELGLIAPAAEAYSRYLALADPIEDADEIAEVEERLSELL